MKNPLISHGAEVFRITGVMKMSDLPENGSVCLGKIYIYIAAGSPFQKLVSLNYTSLVRRRYG
jgi:hypothetical protein